MALKTPSLSVQETRNLAVKARGIKRTVPPSTVQTLAIDEQTDLKTSRHLSNSVQSKCVPGKVRYSVDAPIPAAGNYPAFDKAAKQFGPGNAFRRILKLAYDQFDTALMAGKISGSVNSYKTSDKIISTSKTVSAEVNETLLSRYNASGLLNNSEIGRHYAAEAFLFYIESQ